MMLLSLLALFVSSFRVTLRVTLPTQTCVPLGGACSHYSTTPSGAAALGVAPSVAAPSGATSSAVTLLTATTTPSDAPSSDFPSSEKRTSRRSFVSHSAVATAAAAALSGAPDPASAKLEGVNKPELLPADKGRNVIQVEKYLATNQVKNLEEVLSRLEQDTGFRLRVLTQRYPVTPGLAIRDYWKLGEEGGGDDKYIVMVVDEFGGKGNPLNFNVGEGVKFALPNVYWTRLQGKFGNTFYVRENGLDVALLTAIDSIVNCLRSEDGFCVNP